MNYLSIKEISALWGVCPRRIQTLCKQVRVPGANFVGYTWIIPEDAKKLRMLE